jgi:hypothetical protein
VITPYLDELNEAIRAAIERRSCRSCTLSALALPMNKRDHLNPSYCGAEAFQLVPDLEFIGPPSAYQQALVGLPTRVA